MVKIICRICGKKWNDKRYDMLMKKRIITALRVCCDECVEKIFKEKKLFSLVSKKL
jgi:hypothetical protein